METKKLFNVLVIGGNMLTIGKAVAKDMVDAATSADREDQIVYAVEKGHVEQKNGVICCWASVCDGQSN